MLRYKTTRDGATLARATSGAAGLDLVALELLGDSGGLERWGTGIAVEIPAGHVGLMLPRSSLLTTHGYVGAIGVIDSDYRGELTCVVRAVAAPAHLGGVRVYQLLVMPLAAFDPVEVDELSDTVRGTGGFGSTGV